MTQKIAVAILHGIGNQNEHFADRLIKALDKRCAPVLGRDLVIKSVHWAPVLQEAEKLLANRTRFKKSTVLQRKLRGFMIDFMGDAFAYQPTINDRHTYEGIHARFAGTLRNLAQEAGPEAPLCVISHSLGSIIASNFIYDLQIDPVRAIIPAQVRAHMTATPLELGRTLALFYTLGSPLALFSLRYTEFGRPIQMPPPQLAEYYPRVKAEWINFYDPDDPIGYPLQKLNDAYEKVVSADREVNVGRIYSSWNPLSHMGYWSDKDVINPIAESLCRIWSEVNLPAS